MKKKKLLYIGHAYHNKTKSNLFLLSVLEKKYTVDVFSFDPYKDEINSHFAPLKGKQYDILVLLQIMPSLEKLKKLISFKKSVFFPMYDGIPSRNNPIWYEYRFTQIINFSRTLHEELSKLGFSSHYIQYFPEPSQKIGNMGDTKSVFFWQRITPINVLLIEKLLMGNSITRLHIHKALDPAHTFMDPSPDSKWKITYSEWFNTKEEMLQIQQKSAIYIAPRLYEGIGMSFLEAMAMGRCVIAPNNPTMNEYITNGVNGYLYDPQNPQPIQLGNIRKIQENAIKYIQTGYAKWSKERTKILDWIEEKAIVNQKSIQSHFEKISDVTTYKLFNFLPIIKIREKPGKIKIYLLGCLLLLKIKLNNPNRKKSNFFEKILKNVNRIPFKRNVVLLMDNIFEANANIQDNFTFFKYLYDQKKWKLVPYYILNSQSPYRQELARKYGKHVIFWNSGTTPTWRLKLCFLFLVPRLRYVCDSFQAITAIPFGFHNIVKNTSHMTSIFMQHGVTFFKPDFIMPNVYGKNIFDKVLVSNDMEKQLFIKRGNFKTQDIIKNGLMRWDGIHNSALEQSEKFILIFFTTRRYLSQIQNLKDSQYVRNICDILDCIKKNVHNIKIKIALHHSVADLLSPVLQKMNIDLVGEDDIFKIKQIASLLITDYSSMCFEFFFQEKPVLFYSLNDAEDCQKYGHVLDVVDPYLGKENLLPNIIKNKEHLIKTLDYYAKNHFQLSAKEKEQQNLFFYYKSSFCERLEKYLINNLGKRNKK